MSSSIIKGTGYLISMISVVLLGIVSWRSAQQEPLLAAALFAGAITSMTGMGLRWLSYRMEK